MLVFTRPRARFVAKGRAKPARFAEERWDDAQNDELDRYENDIAMAFLYFISSLQVTLAQYAGVSVEAWLQTGGAVDTLVQQTSQASLRAVIGDITQAGAAQAAQGAQAATATATAASVSAENTFLQQYIQEQTGTLITAVTDSVRQQVKDIIAEAVRTGASVPDIAKALADTIGLTAQQAAQYRRFTGSPAVRQAFLQRLQEQRALTVARTETVAAFHHSQLASWQYSVEQGDLPQESKKKWVTDVDPCIARCASMANQVQPLDQPFVTGLGEQIMAPGAHPRCRCSCILILPT